MSSCFLRSTDLTPRFSLHDSIEQPLFILTGGINRAAIGVANKDTLKSARFVYAIISRGGGGNDVVTHGL